MLYFAEKFRHLGFNSAFRIGNIQFSSAVAALQCIALVWNIGHLPGTFSVEKGVYRFLWHRDSNSPARELRWPFSKNDRVGAIARHAGDFLSQNDYRAVCRVLAVLKLLRFCESENDPLFSFATDFAAPILLDFEGPYSAQWPKLKQSFTTIRHLSYLTVDLPFSGHRWAPNIPDLVEHAISRRTDDLETIAAQISELLSPVERGISDALYHSPRARKEAVLFASRVEARLKKSDDPISEIERWLSVALTRDLKLGGRSNSKHVEQCVAIKLRSHFSTPAKSPVELEDGLNAAGFPLACVMEYKSWNSDVLLEPDEQIIEVLSKQATALSDVGAFLSWFIREFDNLKEGPDDYFSIMQKGEIEPGYGQILGKAVELCFPGVTVRLIPWDLTRWGLFKVNGIRANRGGIWATTALLDCPIAKHLLRDRSRAMANHLRDRYEELMGLRKLRQAIRKRLGGVRPRCNWLAITSSIQFNRDGRTIIEYDGGLLRVSSRSGSLEWFGLESKRGRENPKRSLQKRLSALGIDGEVRALDAKHAYVKLTLSSREGTLSPNQPDEARR